MNRSCGISLTVSDGIAEIAVSEMTLFVRAGKPKVNQGPCSAAILCVQHRQILMVLQLSQRADSGGFHFVPGKPLPAVVQQCTLYPN